MLVDINRRKLKLYDRVVCSLPNYSGLVSGTVVKLNPKSVTVEYFCPDTHVLKTTPRFTHQLYKE